MKKSKNRKPQPEGAQAAVSPPIWARRRKSTALACIALAVLVFYWVPLTDPATSPQWDTVDYHLSVQKFAAEELTSLRLPHWSEFAFAGFPFLADPQVGTWYPLNWPFFLLGIGPKTMELELAMHAVLACWGAWLLAGLWMTNRWAAAFSALAYGCSGFFAGHASHAGMFQTTAWLPLLLYGVHGAMAASPPLRPMLWTGLGCAAMFLAGHFQTALYSFAAIGVYALVVAALEQKALAAVRTLAVCAVITVALTAVQWLPALELLGQSARNSASFVEQTNGSMEARALATLIFPDHYGSVSGQPYTGPFDRTQFYLYQGILMTPLALLGLAFSRLRWVALALGVPFLWYSFGPAGGFYKLAARLPGFGSVRAPVHDWFIVCLCLALAAGAGLAWLIERFGLRWLGPVAVMVLFADLYHSNMSTNHLAYARNSYALLYGDAQARFAPAVGQVLPPESRFHAQAGFGGMSSAFETRTPVTHGYNPLVLGRYATYYAAANANPALLNALHVGAQYSQRTATLEPNHGMLPRFFFPKRVHAVPFQQSGSWLANANPMEEAGLEGRTSAIEQDAAATAASRVAGPNRYEIQTNAASPSLLRSAIPWYPAWRAMIDGKPADTRIVDHAMLGIVVPAGAHRVVLEYVPTSFWIGAAISAIAAIALTAGLGFQYQRSMAPLIS